MGNEQLGESSQGVNGRPMKKARFSWQVKGKSRPQMSDSSSENNNVINVSTTADSLESPSNSSTTSYPRYFPSMAPTKRTAEPVTFNTDRMISSPEQVRAAFIADRLDRGLARWQARQVAKGFVDNTINRVLDSWLVAPLPGGGGALGVEDAAILMAISAHGLQNGPPSAHLLTPSVPSNIAIDLALPSGSGRSNRAPVQDPPDGGEHFDFLEAAVAVAIQKKGLAPLPPTLPPSGQS